MTEWMEQSLESFAAFTPRSLPPGFSIAFSGRGVSSEAEASPTAFLARGFAQALDLKSIPIVWAAQVHGNRAAIVEISPASGEICDAGECDALATDLAGVALVVQTADCVPIILAGIRGIGVVHAGWRGSAKNVAGAGVAALLSLGEKPENLRAWLGPAIGACCYEVGSEVAAQFAEEFRHQDDAGRFRLDLPRVNRAQLEAAGVRPDNVLAHPACTKCGGERYASYRRDGVRSGRMIALVARLTP